MSDFQARINSFLWRGRESVFKAGLKEPAACLSFYSMQMIRIVMFFFVLLVWAANFYVNVKKCIVYLNFWALTFTLLYLLWIIPSSGR